MQKFCKNSAKILQKFCKNSAKILQKFCKNSEKILQKFSKNSAKILQKFCKNSAKILQKFCECRTSAEILLHSAKAEILCNSTYPYVITPHKISSRKFKIM
jgi:adenylosuccinate synthase